MIEGFELLNYLGREGEDFLFIISYDKNTLLAYKLDDIPSNIACFIDGKEFGTTLPYIPKEYHLTKSPISYNEYLSKFNQVKKHISAGDTYLLNLTQPTKITSSYTLEDFYTHSKAPYKLYIKDKFVCFSPECFIEIKDSIISTHPMKGTIDASIENAREKILSDTKELAEHTMIVDLMRNDLNMVGSNTKVEKFRYIDKIYAGKKSLLQVSSHISSKLDKSWREHIGDILYTLTPAGSITGTPKKKTIELIEKIEGYKRGFYTGIFGVCIGNRLKSAVMIRFVEKYKDYFIYKSGGGITSDSDAKLEYQEMIDKVY